MTSVHCILISILCVTMTLGLGYITISKQIKTLIDSNLLLSDQLKVITELLLVAKKNDSPK